MRTLNVRLFVILLASCGGVYLAITVLHAYQVRRNAVVFLQQAERAKERAAEARKRGDWEAQQKELRDVLQNYNSYVKLVPKDIDALQDLGFLLADLSDYRTAFTRLEEVLRRDPKRTEVRRRLIDVLMSMRRFPDARVHIQQYLLKDSPDDAKLLELLGKCQMAGDEFDAALESFQRAIELAPDQLEAYRFMAAIYRHERGRADNDKADEYMEKMVTANPKLHKAHLWYGIYLDATRKPDEAMAEALEALELEPKDRDTLFLAARCALGKKEYDKARKYAQEGIKEHPRFVPLYITMADVELLESREDEQPKKSPDEQPEKTPDGQPEKTPDQQRRLSQEAREKAMVWLRKGLEATNNHPELLWRLANLLVDGEQFEEASRIADQLDATANSNRLGGFLRARIEFMQGDWLAACQGFTKVRSRLTAFPQLLKQADYWQGRCYRKLGNTDQELTAYRRALAVDPFYARARAGLASALLRSGQLGEAISELRSALKLDESTGGGPLALVRMLILKNLRQSPARRDWKEVERVLRQAAEVNPYSAQLLVYRSEILVAQNRVEDAEKLLSAACDQNPENVALWSMLASLAQRRSDWNRAEQVLQEAREQLGDKVELRLAHAQYVARRYGNEAADRLRKMAREIGSLSEEDRLRLWKGLLTTAQQVGDDEQVEFLCRRVAKMEPGNLRVWFLLFEIALRANDDRGMNESLAEIRKIEGEGPYWLYGHAARLSVQAKKKDDKSPQLLSRAEQYLNRALESRPTWSRLVLLAAAIYDQQGKEEQALETYLRAISTGENNPGAVRRVVQLLFQRRRYADAGRLLEDMEERNAPFSGEMSRQRVELDIMGGNFARAERRARDAVAEDSNDYRNYMWLGQVLRVLGMRANTERRNEEAKKILAEAEQAFRRATEMAGQQPGAWIALVQFLGATKQIQAAEEAIAQAEGKIPSDQLPLALAQCYGIIGQQAEAEARYKQALAAAPDDAAIVRSVADFYWRTGKPEAAEVQLRRITDGKVKAQQGDLIWARRRLALIIGARGGFQNLQKGLELIEKNLAAVPSSIQDQRMKRQFLASHPDRIKREQAIQAMEDLRTASPEDLFLQVQLLLGQGDWLKASKLMQELLAHHGKEPRYLAAYVKALLKQNEIQEAERYLRLLEKIAPNEFRTIDFRAEVMFRHKEFDRVLKLLVDVVDKPEVGSGGRVERLQQAASSLDRFALQLKNPGNEPFDARFAQQAELFYRQYVEQRPRQELALVAFLGRHGRIDEALTLFQRAWKNGNPVGLAKTGILLAKSPQATEVQAERGVRILQAALERYKRPVSLLLVMAAVRTDQKRYDEAEAFYREIIKKNSGNVVAMNNLAVLLALQGKKLDEALRLIDRAIGLAGPVASMLDTRATVHMARGQAEPALAELKRAIAERATPVRLFHRAQAHLLAGNAEAAAKDVEEANDSGLKPEMLQPLERPVYDKLQALLQ